MSNMCGACVDYTRVVPGNAQAVELCLQGEVATWAKLSAIHTNCGIEMKLDACLTKLIQGMMARKPGGQIGISSTDLLPANGLPNVPASAHSLGDIGQGKHGLKPGQHGMGSRIPSWINMNALSEQSHPTSPGRVCTAETVSS